MLPPVLGSVSQRVSNRPCLGKVHGSAWATTSADATARLSIGCHHDAVAYLDGQEVYGSIMRVEAWLPSNSRWTELHVEGNVPSMCADIWLTLHADGGGTVVFDDASLAVAR